MAFASSQVAESMSLIKTFFSRSLSRSKIVELEEELRVVGNNLKSLEVSEEKVNSRVLRSRRAKYFWRLRAEQSFRIFAKLTYSSKTFQVS